MKKKQALIEQQYALETASAKALAERQKIETQATLELLKKEQEAAEAEAELNVLRSFDGDEQNSHRSLPSLPESDSQTKTKNYIENLSIVPPQEPSQPNVHNVYEQQTLNVNNAVKDQRMLRDLDHRNNHRELRSGPPASIHPNIRSLEEPPINVHSSLNPNALSYNPANTQSLSSDFTKFLLKKDLLLTRLTSFNDKPETYASWKNSFKNIMEELGVTPVEEVDLLVKWLGKDSQKYAQSLKTSTSSDPVRELRRIWDRLDERYGAPEMVEAALKRKIDSFARITSKNFKLLYDLSDVLSEIEAVKEDTKYSSLLGYYDSSSGVTPIVRKLPVNLQEKWTNVAVKYIEEHRVPYPPFSIFVDFIRKLSRTKNNPSFIYDPQPSEHVRKDFSSNRLNDKTGISALKTNFVGMSLEKPSSDPTTKCPLHHSNHALNKCKAFRFKPLEARKKLLKENGICFRCCASTSHIRRDCKVPIKCEECGNDRHPTALHVDFRSSEGIPPSTQSSERDSFVKNSSPLDRSSSHGGEESLTTETPKPAAKTLCTQVQRGTFNGKSCSKTLLARVYRKGNPEDQLTLYAIIDDQSNKSLVSPGFFQHFSDVDGYTAYTLSSCMGRIDTFGRRATGFMIESFDGSCTLDLPTLIECDQVPNSKDEIPTCDVANHYPHLTEIAHHFPPIDDTAQVSILIGRDLPEAHHVQAQITGQKGTPFAQKIALGWTLIGETCIGKFHRPDIKTYKTSILGSGRATMLKPCDSDFEVKEKYEHFITTQDFDNLGCTVFQKSPNDEKPGLSNEDREFLRLMDKEFTKDSEGYWTAPLPFRSNRLKLPDNKAQALKRARSLHISMQKDPLKKEHMFTFMQGILGKGHAEVALPVQGDKERWYLPIFGVYHPRKPNQIRGVFDSSAKHCGVSLNDVLLSGPDLLNSLLGVLMRFRREPIAVMTDVQQMFYCFRVKDEHKDYLRFLWYRGNDPNAELIDYRMRVHVFGNSPSPAVASYGLKKIAWISGQTLGEDVANFLQRDFYVDDGLTSLPSEAQAIDLLTRTRSALHKEGRLHLHKIASNSRAVMKAFGAEDLAKELKEVDIGEGTLPVQRSLGIS